MATTLEDWERAVLFLGVAEGVLANETVDGQIAVFCRLTDMDSERARLAFGEAARRGMMAKDAPRDA